MAIQVLLTKYISSASQKIKKIKSPKRQWGKQLSLRVAWPHAKRPVSRRLHWKQKVQLSTPQPTASNTYNASAAQQTHGSLNAVKKVDHGEIDRAICTLVSSGKATIAEWKALDKALGVRENGTTNNASGLYCYKRHWDKKRLAKKKEERAKNMTLSEQSLRLAIASGSSAHLTAEPAEANSEVLDRGTSDQLRRIMNKSSLSLSKRVKCIQTGRIYENAAAAVQDLMLLTGDRYFVSNIHMAAKKGWKLGGRYNFTFLDYPNIEGEVWRRLGTLPAWYAQKRKLAIAPIVWGRYEVSNKGRIRRLGQEPSFGTLKSCEYPRKSIGHFVFLMHTLVFITFADATIPEGFQIDHIDGVKTNNCIENLRAVSTHDHSLITTASNPLMKQRQAERQGRLVVLKWADRADMMEHVGQAKSATIFADILKARGVVCATKLISQRASNNARRTFKKQPTSDKTGCYFELAEDQMLPDEEMKAGHIEINGTLRPFQVTSLGRLRVKRGGRLLQMDATQIAGKKCYTHILVLLAFSNLSTPPSKEGKKMTVDHINGRSGPFPHRLSNLRWATQSQQNVNRIVLD